MMIERLLRSLLMHDGSKPKAWKPSIGFANESYNKFTESGGQGYTPDGLFHFFGPDGPTGHSLAEWNKPELWRGAFLSDLSWTAIAEDAFGYQFCMRADGRRPVVKVISLWAGDFILVGNSFEGFIRDVVLDTDGWRGFKERYAKITGEIGMKFQALKHLAPEIPPLLAPVDQEASFKWTDSVANASLLAQVYTQVKDLPPGATISQVIIQPKADASSAERRASPDEG